MSKPLEYTPENERLMVAILGPVRKDHKTTVLLDGFTRRINGRYIVGNVPLLDPDGDFRTNSETWAVVTRRQRFRIPKGHPWRGQRP